MYILKNFNHQIFRKILNSQNNFSKPIMKSDNGFWKVNLKILQNICCLYLFFFFKQNDSVSGNSLCYKIACL